MTDSSDKINFEILSKSGKAAGKVKNCYNFHSEQNGQVSWMDFEDVNDIREMQEDKEIVITISDGNTMEDKRKEFDHWNANGVFEEVEWEGQGTTSA